MEELERIIGRARVLPLAIPLLILVGFAAGQITKRVLTVPDDEPVWALDGTEMPRKHLEVLSTRMHDMHKDGARTVEYVKLYREHVEPIERVLRRRGVSRAAARRISWPLVEQSYTKGLDPATVVSIMLMESGGKPTARSSVGARGLMQVMPLWAGRWRDCGRDLFDVEDNLCNGTSILAWYLQRHGSERQALLGYNGCVRGANTPNCFSYPEKVWRLREQIKLEITRERARINGKAGD